jgi:hypothetical protein
MTMLNTSISESIVFELIIIVKTSPTDPILWPGYSPLTESLVQVINVTVVHCCPTKDMVGLKTPPLQTGRGGCHLGVGGVLDWRVGGV